MATLQELERALINADKANDAAAAKALAVEISRIKSQETRQADPEWEGTILPFSSKPDGGVKLDWSAGLPGMVGGAVTLPGDVYVGKVDPFSDEGIGRATDLGILANPTATAIRAGERAIPGVLKGQTAKPAPPTMADLLIEGGRGFEKARKMGVQFDSAAFSKEVDTVMQNLYQEGFHPSDAKRTFSILSDFLNPPPGSVVDYQGYRAARKALGNVAGNFNEPTDQKAALEAIKRLDAIIEKPPAQSVVAGDAAALSKIDAEARGNYAAGLRSKDIASVGAKAYRRAKASNSGQNVGNTIRQRVASLLDNPKARAGFTPDEIALLEKVAEGTNSRNALRWASSVLGGGGGLGAATVSGFGALGGSAVGGTPGAVVGAVAGPFIGASARAWENALTGRALSAVDEATRMRSPLYDKVPVVLTGIARRNAIAKALLASVAAKSNEKKQPSPRPSSPYTFRDGQLYDDQGRQVY